MGSDRGGLDGACNSLRSHQKASLVARAGLAAVLLGVVTTCGGASSTAGETAGPTAGATPASTAGRTVDACAREDAHTKIVTFKGGGSDLEGVVIGEGDAGVVLAHQLHSNLCSWLPFANILAEHGLRVLAFDFQGFNSLDRQVLAAVAELRRLGVNHVALAGASMGGTAVLAAAGRSAAVARVASLSGPQEFSDLSPSRAVGSLAIPVLFIAASDDSLYVADARAMYRRARESDKRLLVVPGSEHGTELLENTKVEQNLLAFLAG